MAIYTTWRSTPHGDQHHIHDDQHHMSINTTWRSVPHGYQCHMEINLRWLSIPHGYQSHAANKTTIARKSMPRGYGSAKGVVRRPRTCQIVTIIGECGLPWDGEDVDSVWRVGTSSVSFSHGSCDFSHGSCDVPQVGAVFDWWPKVGSNGAIVDLQPSHHSLSHPHPHALSCQAVIVGYWCKSQHCRSSAREPVFRVVSARASISGQIQKTAM
jgi:hypothetical protein